MGSSRGVVRATPPVLLLDVELARPPVGSIPLDGARNGSYAELRAYVTLHSRPVGVVTLPLGSDGLDYAMVADAIWGKLAPVIRRHCVEDGLEEPASLVEKSLLDAAEPPCAWRNALSAARPSATVVITTCGGPDSRLLTAVGCALAQTYPCFDVVVVDNRPATSGVETKLHACFGDEERLRYVAEPRPGLSNARNRGAEAAGGEIVAFTDDDVVIDPDWLAWLVTGFGDPLVGCVTGLILPLELESPAQRRLEEFAGYGKGYERRLWDMGEHRLDHVLYPYVVGVYGSGANMAFRRQALADLGGFDPALGTGTLARGGEDLDIFVRCIQAGLSLLYEPAARVRHSHERDTRVGRKVFDYGVGLGTMLTKHVLSDPAIAAGLIARLPRGAVHLLSAQSPKNSARSASYPLSLKMAELAGLAYAPVAYVRSRARERRRDAQASSPTNRT